MAFEEALSPADDRGGCGLGMMQDFHLTEEVKMFVRLTLAALFLLTASGAEAQINPFRSVRGQRLESSDVVLMDQAARHLLGPTAPVAGAIENWSNPKTGVSGAVTYIGPTTPTVRGVRQSCRKLRYAAAVKNQPDTRSYDIEWCHQPDGTWKSR